MSAYTAIAFAPVQGFIEKSRKLRDLYGASLILSFLSFKLVQKAESLGLKVISPGLPTIQEGMPNRILIKGKFERNDVQNTLLKEWQEILKVCREWIEDNLDIPKGQYYWSQTEDKKGRQKGEWERWGSYTWEIFWGYGESEKEAIKKAMDDLETRKLKRDWTAINWMGESSSLTGTDAIAWHQLGKESKEPGRSLTRQEQEDQELFYRRLSWLLDNPDYRVGKPSLSLENLREYEKSKPDDIGKYIAFNERLSIPELVKRLVTYDKIADDIGIEKLKKKPDDPEFKDINREAGYWTGWFMGDGDKVGDKLKELATRPENDENKQEHDLKSFTELMRNWGKGFQNKKDLFPQGKGRVIYAGGDDFLGVLYSEKTDTQEKPEKVKPIEALNWLLTLEDHWKDHQNTIKQEFNLDFTYSVGFVWAGHQVPQRDILQHCREAEKRAKSLGRDRVTLRVVFNSGQFVQWTCPWDYLHVLRIYRDRDGKTWGEKPNWTHIYNDWAQLKARHAIRLQEMEELSINKELALALFNLYFDNAGEKFKQERKWIDLAGDNSDSAIVNWIDDLVLVGWQLCQNSNI
ncbi:CRISPR-associated protein Cmr2 [Microcoleus vaginatus PCC 9802]|uniref:Cas10/Cmr2 second palm domain-containing protein n=1 Tax=Microcoleus vaginatus TaxID=119532 RepID=UPI000586A7F6|nr:CRISPR-associated protein Cmr2 [Microcoleus vaginatus PCC 9802]